MASQIWLPIFGNNRARKIMLDDNAFFHGTYEASDGYASVSARRES